MADFSTPFGQSSDRRFPTVDEAQNGFPCGPADQRLFNGLHYRTEAEIGEVIEFAGIVPTNDRFTQLREAIEALIAAATGGGDTSQFLLVSQARARLPIFPDVPGNGKITVSVPSAGNVRVDSGFTILHRGIYPVVTGDALDAARTFATVASKVYHLRVNLSTGVYSLNDLAGGPYNPGALAETDSVAFDSKFDDMLIARVVTNGANVPTITTLANKYELLGSGQRSVSTTPATTDTYTLDWARTPTTLGFSSLEESPLSAGNRDGGETNVRVTSTRYAMSVFSYAVDIDDFTQRAILYTARARA